MRVSFITCSRRPEDADGLRQNLREVLGPHPQCDYELFVADGTASDGICAAYNLGAEQSTYECLAFLHDDVRLLMAPWVLEKAYTLTQKPLTGIVGAAGTRALPESGCWWKSANADCRGAVHHPGQVESDWQLNGWPYACAQYGRVVSLDGVFLMCSRRVFQKLKGFDAAAYAGSFHAYDVDLSVRAHLAGLSNHVAPLPLYHGSPGRPGPDYDQALKVFRAKFGAKLPIRI